MTTKEKARLILVCFLVSFVPWVCMGLNGELGNSLGGGWARYVNSSGDLITSLNGVTVETLNADGLQVTGAITAAQGISTGDGYGVGVGCAIPNVNAIDYKNAASLTNSGSDLRHIAVGGTMYTRTSGAAAPLHADRMTFITSMLAPIIYANTLKDTGDGTWATVVSGLPTFPNSLIVTPASLPGSPSTGQYAIDSAAANAAKSWDGTAWDTLSN